MTVGYLTPVQFGLLAVFTFALLAVFWIAIADARRIDARKSVEVEEDESRAVLKLVGQHHPSCGKIEDDAIPFILDDTDSRDEFLRAHGIGKGHIA